MRWITRWTSWRLPRCRRLSFTPCTFGCGLREFERGRPGDASGCSAYLICSALTIKHVVAHQSRLFCFHFEGLRQVDDIPLSRPKKNIARDFSDGGVCARRPAIRSIPGLYATLQPRLCAAYQPAHSPSPCRSSGGRNRVPFLPEAGGTSQLQACLVSHLSPPPAPARGRSFHFYAQHAHSRPDASGPAAARMPSPRSSTTGTL